MNIMKLFQLYPVLAINIKIWLRQQDAETPVNVTRHNKRRTEEGCKTIQLEGD